MNDDLIDVGSPNCPTHLVPLHAFGCDEEGRDARWECVVPDCTWVQLA